MRNLFRLLRSRRRGDDQPPGDERPTELIWSEALTVDLSELSTMPFPAVAPSVAGHGVAARRYVRQALWAASAPAGARPPRDDGAGEDAADPVRYWHQVSALIDEAQLAAAPAGDSEVLEEVGSSWFDSQTPEDPPTRPLPRLASGRPAARPSPRPRAREETPEPSPWIEPGAPGAISWPPDDANPDLFR